MTTALIILVATYAAVGVGRLPGLRIDRPAAALIGALAMVIAGVLAPADAYAAVDLSTLALLLGLMMLAASLARAGFFAVVSGMLVRHARGPRTLLAAIVVASGVLSAFLLNDAVCILFTPLVLVVTRRAGRAPLPYLLAVATASNVGSACSISGNPQNALIGAFSGIPYGTFLVRLLPASAIGLASTFGILAWVYRRELAAPARPVEEAKEPSTAAVVPGGAPREDVVDRRRLAIGLLGAAGMVAAFLAGADYALAALTAAAAVLVTTGDGSRDPFRGVDWPLLLTFAGLFVVTEGARRAGVADRFLEGLAPALAADPWARTAALSGLTGVLSNLVSNVPAVMLLGPVLRDAQVADTVWLAVAMSSTFAGNLTLVGSLANLIVAELAREECPISFLEYLKVGVPITLATTAAGVAVVAVQ